MNPLLAVPTALRALARNKMRSFLTTLGIIIGVAAVIAVVSIGEGAKAQVISSFQSMGTNLVIILPGSSKTGGMRGGFGSMVTITWDDYKAIHQEVPGVRYLSPSLRSSGTLIGEGQNWTTSVTGVSPEYFGIREWSVAQGDLFSQSDLDSGNKVVVLGQTVADELFGANATPVGQIVRLNSIPYQVIGVMAKKGQSPMGQDYDDEVFIPYTTFLAKVQGGLQKYIGGAVMVGVEAADKVTAVQDEIIQLLRSRHHLTADEDDDFSVRNFDEVANAMESSAQTLMYLLASVAAVSLLVGGIGIMNIMLVSVTERTREIGLRAAVGAAPQQILWQFLVEAFSLSLIGGLLGVALGLFLASRLAASFGWPFLMQVQVIAISIGFSALVGIGFGLYPAYKASRLDPIESLRYE
ncbi:MAG: FtsX-like permease family protein [Myxococcales bacterium]|nr:FtsX-like permease family protein [Myxococcales bacterium]